MFNFFKEKIKSWVGKTKEKLEENEEKAEESEVAVEETKKEEKAVKEERKKETKKKEEKPSKKKDEKKKEVTPKKQVKKKKSEEEIKEEKEIEIEEEEVKEEIKEIEKEEKETLKEEKKIEEEKKVELVEEKPEVKEEIKPSFFKRIFKREKKEEIKEEVKEPEEKIEEVIKVKDVKEVKAEEVEKKAEEFVVKPEKIKEEKISVFKKIKERFSYKISEQDFEEIFEDLELMLLESNVALEATDAIKKQLKEELVGHEIKKDALEEKIKDALRKSIDNILIEPDDLVPLIKSKKPFVMVFFGINGTGKTTTIAKVANLLQKNNISCVLAAGDTFRAASIEQLEYHATKLGVKVIKHDYGADPAAVAFDAIKHAKAHGIQAVLIDTAGRMHTKDNLLSEMEKIVRVTDPDLKIFVAESIAGNDAIQQARNFNEAIGIDGCVLTKADVDEKGGTAISISYITKKPILFLGTGQEYENIEVFNKEKFMDALFS